MEMNAGGLAILPNDKMEYVNPELQQVLFRLVGKANLGNDFVL